MSANRTRNWVLLILATAALVAAAYFIGRGSVGVSESGEGADAAVGGDGRKVLYWHDPMIPTEIYDKPGKSSMGMDLIPVYEDEAGKGSGGIVSIDPGVVQNMGVRTAPVERMDFSRHIRTVGKVEYNEETLHIVNTKISGWIEKLHVAFTGKSVRKGDPLLEIYSPELVTTQQEYLLALSNSKRAQSATSQAAMRDADKLLNSTRERLLFWDIPPAEIDRLERTGEVRKTVLLEAPRDGVVVKKTAVEGAFIEAGMDLYEIADLSKVWVYASVYDNEVPWITVGQEAAMELSYQPGKTFTGRVSYIYPYLREKARDVYVRLIFSNPDLALKPGMYVNVTLEGKVVPNAIVVPSEAVIRSGVRSLVFVVAGPGKFEPREIRAGDEGGAGNAYVHVLSGLLGNEVVVTSAQFMLDSESRLQEAVQKMLNSRDGSAGNASGMDDARKDSGIGAQPAMEDRDHDQMEAEPAEEMPEGGQDGQPIEDHDGKGMEGMDQGGPGLQGMDHGGRVMENRDRDGHEMHGMDHDVATEPVDLESPGSP